MDDEGGFDGGVNPVEADWWGGRNPLRSGVDEEGERFVAGVEPEIAFFGIGGGIILKLDDEIVDAAEGFDAPFAVSVVPGVGDSLGAAKSDLSTGKVSMTF